MALERFEHPPELVKHCHNQANIGPRKVYKGWMERWKGLGRVPTKKYANLLVEYQTNFGTRWQHVQRQDFVTFIREIIQKWRIKTK